MSHRVIECKNNKQLTLTARQWETLLASMPNILGAMNNPNYSLHLGHSLFVTVVDELSIICFQQWVDDTIDETWYLSYSQLKEFQIYALFVSNHFDDCIIPEEVFDVRINCAPFYEIVRWNNDKVIYLINLMLDDTINSQKAFSFPLYRWKTLEQVINLKMNDTEWEYHVGGGIFMHVLPPNTIQLKEGDHKMQFTYEEWSTLSKHIRHICEVCRDMESIQPCYMDHDNQLAEIACAECTPNPFEDDE